MDWVVVSVGVMVMCIGFEIRKCSREKKLPIDKNLQVGKEAR
jgi:hypothetical protein